MSSEPARIYLDNNATTRPLPEVVDEVARHLAESYGNPGSRHAEGRAARRVLESARERIAAVVGAEPEEVVFTSGGTESSNMAIFGAATGPPGTILLTVGEHPATLESCRHLEKAGWRLQFLDVDSDGRLCDEVINAVDWRDVRLATVILAHNETGVIQDLDPLAAACREHRVPLHVDAVQAVGKIPVDFHALGATTLALGAHKFHGPRGIGALVIRDGVQLAPFQFGGHQERGRRPGTELVALAAGMAKALEIWNRQREDRTARIAALRNRLQQGLQAACEPIVVNGSEQHRLPNTLNIAFPGLDGEAILVALDLAGVACSLGSTCASGSAEPAPALTAMNVPPEVAKASVRLSLSVFNTPEEIDEGVERISKVIAQLRSQEPSSKASKR